MKYSTAKEILKLYRDNVNRMPISYNQNPLAYIVHTDLKAQITKDVFEEVLKSIPNIQTKKDSIYEPAIQDIMYYACLNGNVAILKTLISRDPNVVTLFTVNDPWIPMALAPTPTSPLQVALQNRQKYVAEYMRNTLNIKDTDPMFVQLATEATEERSAKIEQLDHQKSVIIERAKLEKAQLQSKIEAAKMGVSERIDAINAEMNSKIVAAASACLDDAELGLLLDRGVNVNFDRIGHHNPDYICELRNKPNAHELTAQKENQIAQANVQHSEYVISMQQHIASIQEQTKAQIQEIEAKIAVIDDVEMDVMVAAPALPEVVEAGSDLYGAAHRYVYEQPYDDEDFGAAPADPAAPARTLTDEERSFLEALIGRDNAALIGVNHALEMLGLE